MDWGGYFGNITLSQYHERTPGPHFLIDVDFEGHKFKAIDNYDVYLTGLFGDWRTPPPVEKRKSHHVFSAYWKNSE